MYVAENPAGQLFAPVCGLFVQPYAPPKRVSLIAGFHTPDWQEGQDNGVVIGFTGRLHTPCRTGCSDWCRCPLPSGRSMWCRYWGRWPERPMLSAKYSPDTPYNILPRSQPCPLSRSRYKPQRSTDPHRWQFAPPCRSIRLGLSRHRIGKTFASYQLKQMTPTPACSPPPVVLRTAYQVLPDRYMYACCVCVVSPSRSVRTRESVHSR